MKSTISFSGTGAKNTAKKQLPPFRVRKKQKFVDLTERGKPNDIARCSIIQVSTVFQSNRLDIHMQTGGM